jgi:hypothetical protein
MTSLRDPRFEKALQAAPDAHLRPDAHTRQAVLAAAAAAVQTQSAHQPVAWWRRQWFGGAGGGAGRMPWNAALATVLLAGFVTLLWQGQPVPDAQRAEAPASEAMRQTAPSPAKPTQAPVAAGDAVPSIPPSTAPSPKSAPQPPPQAPPAPSAKAAADADARADAPRSAPRQEPVPAPAATPAPAIAQERSSEAAPTSSAQRADAAAAPAESSASAQASAALSEPARAAAPGLAAGSALGRAAPVSTPDSAALQGWTELRITQGGQTRRIARADATALAAQVRRLAPANSGESAMPRAPTLRIAFAQGDEVLAEFELGEPPWVRWTLLRAGFAGQWAAQADRGQLQTLQLELQRLGFTAR